MKLKKIMALIVSAVLCFSVGCNTPPETSPPSTETGTSIHFINVSNITDYYGTSMCVLIRHNGKTVLIDAGTEIPASEQIVKNYLQSEGVTKIDHLILTHSHNDHAGGMAYQIESFDVGTLYTKPVDWSKVKNASNGPTSVRVLYDDVYLAAQYKVNTDGSFTNIVIPNQEGYRVSLDEQAYFEIYNCTEVHKNQYAGQDYNEFSMQIKFTCKNVSAFIGGDATATSDYLVINRVGECELYSLQHHGTALPYTSQVLLDELTPSICVVNGITEAFDNGTRNRCEIFTDDIYVTGEEGNIVFDCDGEHFTFRANQAE